ncbi:uncharacterized protein LOC124898530 [Capsicum annuum]|uniref:uncharacterized protein LOC124898530 n=1 Tax=Capsicum annuum TaxID=4072 RepID=UPI001FB0F56F|nr:uncharacterized protein LOC124898530 [Capsicum annuum]
MLKKKLVERKTIEVTRGVSTVVDSKVTEKKETCTIGTHEFAKAQFAFTIPCTIGAREFAKDLCDLGASINLMPFVIYKKLGLDTPMPTSMWLLIADRSIKRPVGILFDVLVKVDKYILPMDFMILDYEIDQEVPIIPGHPFLAIGRAIVNLELGEMKFRVQKDEVSFKIYKSKKKTVELQVVSVVGVEN